MYYCCTLHFCLSCLFVYSGRSIGARWHSFFIKLFGKPWLIVKHGHTLLGQVSCRRLVLCAFSMAGHDAVCTGQWDERVEVAKLLYKCRCVL